MKTNPIHQIHKQGDIMKGMTCSLGVTREGTLNVGYLRKQTHSLKKWIKYLFCLKASCLLFYRKKTSKPLKLKGEIPLHYITSIVYVGKIGKSEFVFDIHTPYYEKKMRLKADNEEECLQWIEMLNSSIADYVETMKEKLELVKSQNKRDNAFSRSDSTLLKGKFDVPKFQRSSYNPEHVRAKDFRKLFVIGEGSFGIVYLVEHTKTKEIYALKVINKDHIRSTNHVEGTLNELSILKNVNHPFLMKVHHAFQTRENLMLVLDFSNGGELFYHLEIADKFEEDRARFYAAEICLALEHLHSMKIVYRDLKPQNVILSSNGHVVLTDFGMSKILTEETTKSFCGTPEYMSPEVILNEDYGQYVDWWSFGILLYEMLTGEPAFYGPDPRETFKNILNEDINFPKSLSEEAVNLITHLTEKNVEDRLIDPELIKAHPFFKTIDWRRLEELKIEPPYVPQVNGPSDVQFIDREYLEMNFKERTHSKTEMSFRDHSFDEFFYSTS